MNDALWLTGGIVAAMLVTALHTWVASRGLPARRDEPGFPERMQRYRSRSRMFGLFLGVVVVVIVGIEREVHVTPFSVAWLVAATAAGLVTVRLVELPAMRRLHEDPSPLGATVGDEVRVFLAFRVFGILLLLGPYIVALGGAFDWVVALVLLGAWTLMRPGTIWRALGAEDYDAPHLRAIDAGATCPRPRLGLFGNAHGGMANALALDGKVEPRVLFGRRALREMSEAEVSAIYAHELAYLEEPEVLHLRSRRRWVFALWVTAVVAPVVLARAHPDALTGFLWLWMLIVVIVSSLVARGSQHVESGCDARAMELGADPEALCGGLVTLYRTNFMPRRLARDAEKAATHPSLARRLRDIRAAANPDATEAAETTRPEFGAHEVVDARKPHRTAVLDAEGITWRDARRDREEQLAYGEMLELRLVPARKGMVLRALDRNRRRRDVRVAVEHVEGTQAFLDSVDDGIAFGERGSMLPLARLSGALAALASIVVMMHYATLELVLLPLVAVIAALSGRVDAIVSAGALQLVLAGMLFTLPGVVEPVPVQIAWGFCVLFALVSAVVAIRSDPADRSPVTMPVFLGLALVAAALQLLPTLEHSVLQGLYSLASRGGAVFALATGAGVACLLRRRRAWVAIGVALLLFGLARFPVSSIAFLRDVVADPFVASHVPTIERRSATVLRDVSVDGVLSSLQFAADGSVVASPWDYDETEPSWVRVSFDGTHEHMTTPWPFGPPSSSPVHAHQRVARWPFAPHTWAMVVEVVDSDAEVHPVGTSPLWVGAPSPNPPDAPLGVVQWGSDFTSIGTVDRASGAVTPRARYGRLHRFAQDGRRFYAVHADGVLVHDLDRDRAELWEIDVVSEWDVEIVARDGRVVIMVQIENYTRTRFLWLE